MSALLLLVEDEELSRDMLSRRLERRGYRVIAAADGREALVLARTSRPDLILMDLSLPTLDGWEATRRLKADPTTASIPVIALTAHAMAGDREHALGAGCDSFATKPIAFEPLIAQIEALLAGRPAAPASGRVPGGDTLDVELLAEASRDTGLSVAELVDQFEARSIELLAAGDIAVRSGDMPSLQTHVHKHVGLCGMLGLMRLAVLLREIDQAASRGDVAAAGEAWDLARARVDRVRLLLRSIVQSSA